ncbi:hypothetical protein BDZ89DRAFT_949824 [Hymenopellis radicata]|nr:hypothetical protein BDZ89DRAFT_949824 [Hymenopellis radicata]
MLIKLLAPAHPTVLFAITYQNLPDELYNPVAWTILLNSLSADNLEPPKFIHALDKATWVPSILQEITFNVTTLTVSCLFVDGTCEEWPLMSPACLKALDSVLSDVNMSSAESERERERERHKEKLKQTELARQQSLNSPPTTVKVTGKHKKNRSLLITFVSLPSPSCHDRAASAPITRVPSPNPSLVEPSVEIEPELPPLALLSPKALRRRARSTLVDTFRIHVLSELKTRLPQGGYYPWIVQSMLRRASDAMAEIISQTDGFNSDYTVSPFEDESYFSPPTHMPSPFEDDADTDTDGSSIHTPSTAHFNSVNFSFPPKSPADNTAIPRHLRDLSSDDLCEYNSLSAVCINLRRLLIISEAQKEHVTNEAKQRDDILEIRSRRRAWQNKALVARVGDMDVGLATPYTSSRLSQAMWTAEEYEYVPPSREAEEEMIEEYEYDTKMALGRTRTKGKSDAKLFPVSEEDEEDELFDVREYEVELGFDEGLRSWKIDDDEEEEDEEPRKVSKGPGRGRTVCIRTGCHSRARQRSTPRLCSQLNRSASDLFRGGSGWYRCVVWFIQPLRRG